MNAQLCFFYGNLIALFHFPRKIPDEVTSGVDICPLKRNRGNAPRLSTSKRRKMKIQFTLKARRRLRRSLLLWALLLTFELGADPVWYQKDGRGPDNASGVQPLPLPPRPPQNLRIPLWALIVGYGSQVSNKIGRRARRGKGGRGTRRGKGGTAPWWTLDSPAFLPLLPHAFPSRRLPLSLVTGRFCRADLLLPIKVVAGAGAYLSIILLLGNDIEECPGPMDADDKKYFEALVIGIKSDLQESMKKEFKLMRDELASCKVEVQQLRDENATLVKRVEKLEKSDRILQLERQVRRNNVVIYGAPENVTVDVAVASVLSKCLPAVSLPDYETAYRIGQNRKGKRPILLKFFQQRDKDDLMASVARLKGTGLVVANDLPPEDQAARKVIVEAGKQARARGLTYKMRREGLMIGGSNNVISLAELARPDWLDKWWSANGSQNSQQEDEEELRGRAPKRPNLNRTPPRPSDGAAASTSGLQSHADLGPNFQKPRCDSASSESSNAGRQTRSSSNNKRGKDKT